MSPNFMILRAIVIQEYYFLLNPITTTKRSGQVLESLTRLASGIKILVNIHVLSCVQLMNSASILKTFMGFCFGIGGH